MYRRFSDYLDRLYITRYSFESDLILSDQVVDQSQDVIFTADKTMMEGVPHLITYSDKVKIYWRTTVQSNQQDAPAAGFRMLAYPSGIGCNAIVDQSFSCINVSYGNICAYLK